MSTEELKRIADEKWQAFYWAATASGVWFIACAASLGLAKWSDGAGLAVVLVVLSVAFATVTGLLMFAAMLEAQTEQRKWSAAAKRCGGNPPGQTPRTISHAGPCGENARGEDRQLEEEHCQTGKHDLLDTRSVINHG